MEKVGSYVPEQSIITAEALLKDSNSLEAQKGRGAWWGYPHKGLLLTCSDARVGPLSV